jgi:hypothetical protein
MQKKKKKKRVLDVLGKDEQGEGEGFLWPSRMREERRSGESWR